MAQRKTSDKKRMIGESNLFVCFFSIGLIHEWSKKHTPKAPRKKKEKKRRMIPSTETSDQSDQSDLDEGFVRVVTEVNEKTKKKKKKKKEDSESNDLGTCLLRFEQGGFQASHSTS